MLRTLKYKLSGYKPAEERIKHTKNYEQLKNSVNSIITIRKCGYKDLIDILKKINKIEEKKRIHNEIMKNEEIIQILKEMKNNEEQTIEEIEKNELAKPILEEINKYQEEIIQKLEKINKDKVTKLIPGKMKNNEEQIIEQIKKNAVTKQNLDKINKYEEETKQIHEKIKEIDEQILEKIKKNEELKRSLNEIMKNVERIQILEKFRNSQEFLVLLDELEIELKKVKDSSNEEYLTQQLSDLKSAAKLGYLRILFAIELCDNIHCFYKNTDDVDYMKKYCDDTVKVDELKSLVEKFNPNIKHKNILC
uniref:Borrelia family protein PFam57/62 n=1 Tax=Meloidogyne hapla TaxID=6305 RepID=A0A1I8BRN1_MELHA